MNILKCKVKGCKAVYKTDLPLAPGAEYTCREHMPKGKQRVHFQETQFDKVLRNGRSPLGTNHIKNQGSQVLIVGESVPRDSNE